MHWGHGVSLCRTQTFGELLFLQHSPDHTDYYKLVAFRTQEDLGTELSVHRLAWGLISFRNRLFRHHCCAQLKIPPPPSTCSLPCSLLVDKHFFLM